MAKTSEPKHEKQAPKPRHAKSPKKRKSAVGDALANTVSLDSNVDSMQALDRAFETIGARGNAHGKPVVCYQETLPGHWMVCLLQDDGSYAQCKPYSGTVHGPYCGG